MPDKTSSLDEKSFVGFLQGLKKGEVANQLTGQLQVLIAAIRETGKAGSLTFKLDIKPTGAANSKLIVGDDITLKAPVADRDKCIYFATDDNLLTRDSQEQTTLQFRPTPAPEHPPVPKVAGQS